MADSKISALPASTTPLAGTEVLPIVQSSTTRQVSVANLTAGRAISATQLTLTTGNLIVASGQGIDFSATSGSGTSELLADYEEGTWTPTDASGAGLTLTQEGVATYTKVGRVVTVQWALLYPVTASAAALTIGGLPFTVAASSFNGVSIAQSEFATAFIGKPDATTTNMSFFTFGNSAITNVNFSGLRIRGSATYFV